MVMEIGKQGGDRSVIDAFWDVLQVVLRGFRYAPDTQVRRRAWSKSADRVGEGGHEESKTAR
jgi:hypothetical protein